MIVKRTWEVCTDTYIKDEFNKVWDYVKTRYNLNIKPYLYLNRSNSIHELGLFSGDKNSEQYFITLNKLFLKHKGVVLNTIVHEFAHYVAYKVYGKNCHHNAEWRVIARELGRYFNENITIYCSRDHEVITDAKSRKKAISKKQSKKYIITCTKCNSKFIYKNQMWWFKDKDFIENSGCTCPHCRSHNFKVQEA